MGVVYRATHEALYRSFAVKLLAATRARSEEFLGRFRVEAEALGKLKHPHVVDVTDFGIDPRGGGVAYLVMEYLEGRSLEEHCRQTGPLDLDEALSLLSAMASAVDFAHERGVLHRDLKPANVFLAGEKDARPVVKILDFGLARLVGDAAPRAPQESASPIPAAPLSRGGPAGPRDAGNGRRIPSHAGDRTGRRGTTPDGARVARRHADLHGA